MGKIKRKIFVVIAIITLLFTTIAPSVGASSIGPQFDGRFAYSINETHNFYWYIFPGESMNSKVISFTDNVSTTDLVRYSNNSFFWGDDAQLREPIAQVNANTNLWCFNIDLVVIGSDDYAIDITPYYGGIYGASSGQWTADETRRFEIAMTDESFLLLANNVLYLANYNGALTGTDAVKRVFDNYLVTTNNSLGKYIDSIYLKGVDDGADTIVTQGGWWRNLWDGVDAFLSVEIVPNVTFGLLVSVPLIFAILHLILFIWRSGD